MQWRERNNASGVTSVWYRGEAPQCFYFLGIDLLEASLQVEEMVDGRQVDGMAETKIRKCLSFKPPYRLQKNEKQILNCIVAASTPLMLKSTRDSRHFQWYFVDICYCLCWFAAFLLLAGRMDCEATFYVLSLTYFYRCFGCDLF